MTHATLYRRTLASATLGLLALGLAACGSSGGTSTGGNSASGDYQWGVNAEISGPLAFYGDTIRDGVKAYVDQVNSQGGINGHKINLTILDNAADAARVATNQTQLITSDKVNAVFGNTLSTNCAAATPISERYKVPVSCLSVDQQSPYVYSFGPTNVSAATPAISAAKQISGGAAPKLAVLYPNTGTSIGWYESVKAKAGSDIVVAQKFELTATDFSSLVSKVVAAKPDVILISGTGPNFVAILKGVRAAKLNAPFVWIDGTANLAAIETLSDPGVYAFAAYSLAPATGATGVAKDYVDAITPFVKTVTDTSLANGNSAVAYLGARAFGTALQKCGYPCSGEQLNKQLSNLTVDMSPMEPNYGYSDANGHFPLPNWYLYQVKQGGVYTPKGSFPADNVAAK